MNKRRIFMIQLFSTYAAAFGSFLLARSQGVEAIGSLSLALLVGVIGLLHVIVAELYTVIEQNQKNSEANTE